MIGCSSFMLFHFQMAWSENEDVLSNFQEVQEFCDCSKSRPITQVLDVAHKAILKVKLAILTADTVITKLLAIYN